jgi:Domain of unknown function (DUF4397)
MKNCIRTIFVLALLVAALSTASFASSVYFVQGIAGRNFAAATDPAFPVDILLNDTICYARGVAFGAITGPVTFLPGTYAVKISIADSLAPCSNTPLIDTKLTIERESDMSAVMTLDESGTPELLTFNNSLAPVTPNLGRVLFALGANSAAVDVVLENTDTKKTFTFAVKPAGLLDVNLPAGAYTIAVNQGTTQLAGPAPLFLASQSVNLIYAIGQASNNTVVLETRTLRDVI